MKELKTPTQEQLENLNFFSVKPILNRIDELDCTVTLQDNGKERKFYVSFNENERKFYIDSVKISPKGHYVYRGNSQVIDIVKRWNDFVIMYVNLYMPEPDKTFPDKVEEDFYLKVDMERPKKSLPTDINKQVKDTFVGTYDQIMAECTRKVAESNEEYYKKNRQYATLINDKRNEFIQDLYEYFGVSDNPKAKQLYDLAYQYGVDANDAYATEYKATYHYFSEMVDLIK